jgi:hypothetical protein
MDEEVFEGIKFWLSSRMAEAMKSDDRHRFFLLKQLLDDLTQSREDGYFPWEVIRRGVVDTCGPEALEAVNLGLDAIVKM